MNKSKELPGAPSLHLSLTGTQTANRVGLKESSCHVPPDPSHGALLTAPGHPEAACLQVLRVHQPQLRRSLQAEP